MRAAEGFGTAERRELPPLGWLGTLALFGAAAILLWVATRLGVPAASRVLGVEPMVGWLVVSSLAVFTPLLLTALLLLRQEGRLAGPRAWRERLRFRRMTRRDWAWGVGGLIAVGAASALVQTTLARGLGAADLHPPFLALEPLGPGRYWILAAWLPAWLLNVLGEEILWRGVVLPRQEAALGSTAWLANGCGWLLFHLAFGWQIVLVLLPILFVLPWVAQRRQNTWTAVLIHAGLNGPGFLAVAFGLAGGGMDG